MDWKQLAVFLPAQRQRKLGHVLAHEFGLGGGCFVLCQTGTNVSQ